MSVERQEAMYDGTRGKFDVARRVERAMEATVETRKWASVKGDNETEGEGNLSTIGDSD